MNPSSHDGAGSLGGLFTSSWDLEGPLDAAVAALLRRSHHAAPVAELRLVKVLADRPAIAVGTLVVCSLLMGDVYSAVSCAGLHWSSSYCLTFNATFVLALISWERAVVEDPGRIPENWKMSASGQPLFEQQGGLEFPKKRDRQGHLRYFCVKEEKFRPERAHFCSLLDRNVLRMDHYCVWLANCVGYHNHKYFYLALFYSTAASTIGNVVLVQALLHPAHLSFVQRGLLFPGAALSLLLLSLLWPYLGFHTFLISRNLTTIEYLQTRGELPGLSKYDEGLYGNIQCVLGDFWPLWLLPVSGPSGTGLEWGVAEAQPEEFLFPTKMGEENSPRAEEHSAPSQAAASSASGELALGDMSPGPKRWAEGSLLALEVLACDSWQSLSEAAGAFANLCRFASPPAEPPT